MPDPADRPADPVVRLVDLRTEVIDVDEVLAALDDPSSGALDLFVGRVRDEDGGRGVRGLQYSAHPGAVDQMAAVCAEVASDFDVRAVAVLHRVGDLAIGDVAVVCGVASGHRGVAFEATRALIDRLKARVPIWKHQLFVDGSDEWVGTP
ncbi:molybdenum cofactor biosynthesis protein MoaE [Nocardioides alkalitolerans]|uniref:molybdenum cofactor biosynthesis protein MoaE n=1 Tax=Nocardioides alkalitolerans TaxID=281714 RepID=UPI000405DEF3|nr:molybdenum cofactor biosynthesis protein MoaE [Nocardioides alkalitolerans]